MFTTTDVRQLQEAGIERDEAERQIRLFERPKRYLEIVRPCRLGDGIRVRPDVESRRTQIIMHPRRGSSPTAKPTEITPNRWSNDDFGCTRQAMVLFHLSSLSCDDS